MLDTFAQTVRSAPRSRAFCTWKSVSDEIAELEDADQEKLRLLDLWQFQRKEIETAELSPSEDNELEAERRVQQNAGRLLETAGAAYESLYETPESCWAALRNVAKKLDELARIDTAMLPVRQSLEPALIAIQDVSYALRDYLGSIEANPARLEEIESRLAAIDKLKRKYGASAEEILAFLDDVVQKIGEVETAGERLEALEPTAKRSPLSNEESRELTSRHAAAATALSKRVEEELKPLAMERTRFRLFSNPRSGRKPAPTASSSWSPQMRAKSPSQWRKLPPAENYPA